MAKKKEEEAKKGSPAWMATFSDLMNLLLCFFVLLFAMSSVDADKWEQVVASFSNSFSIFNAGSTMIGEGTLVGEGTTQLNELDEMAQAMGQTSNETGEDVKDQTSGNVDNNQSGPANGEQEGNPSDGQHNDQSSGQNPDGPDNGGNNSANNEDGGNNSSNNQDGGNNSSNNQDGGQSFEDKLNQANFEETQGMLDDISEMTEYYNLDGQLELGMDQNGKYVEIIISGSILFDSGSADLKEEGKILMSKVGDIIRSYAGHNAQVIGHTDNVPVRSSKYGSNDMLSSARAISAAQYLVKEKNIDVTRLSWTGRGEYDPVASNATADGRARNRRIEIRIYNSFNSD